MKHPTLALALLMALAGPASAQGPYIGLGLGYSLFDVDTDTNTTSVDDSGNAWKLFGGFMLSPNLGVELGFVDHGKASLSAAGRYSDSTGTYDYVDDFSWRSTSLYLAGVGALPIAPTVDIFAKAGLQLWEMEMKWHQRDYLAGTGTLDYNAKGAITEDGISPMLAVGGEFFVMPQVSVRVEIERYFDVGKSANTGKTDVDIVSVSASYRF